MSNFIVDKIIDQQKIRMYVQNGMVIYVESLGFAFRDPRFEPGLVYGCPEIEMQDEIFEEPRKRASHKKTHSKKSVPKKILSKATFSQKF